MSTSKINMLTREETFNVIAMVLAVFGLAISIVSAAFAFSSFQQSSVNTQGINAQVRAQRKLLMSALAQPPSAAVGMGATAVAPQTAVLDALRALQEYKLPEDQGA